MNSIITPDMLAPIIDSVTDTGTVVVTAGIVLLAIPIGVSFAIRLIRRFV